MTTDNCVLFVCQLSFGYCYFAVPPSPPPHASWELLLLKTSSVLGTRRLHPVHLPIAAGFSSHGGYEGWTLSM